MKQETLSNSFKIAHVISIPKVSRPKSFDDLRPISLLPAFAKIFEKILETKMTKYLDQNKIITPSQFGFRTKSFTKLAITTLYDKLLTNLNENKVTFSLFLDLKKAFDSVNHPILLKKLYHYGYRGPVFNLLQSYLSRLTEESALWLKEKLLSYAVSTTEYHKVLFWDHCYFYCTSMTYPTFLNLNSRCSPMILICISPITILNLCKYKQQTK